MLYSKELCLLKRDLKTFLDRLKERAPEEIEIVNREIDPEFEIASLVRACEEQQTRGQTLPSYPLILCNNVKGYENWRVVTNVLGTRRRMAEALQCNVENLLSTYLELRQKNPGYTVVENGPVKDVVKTGDEVDISDLPLLTHTPEEPAPFITAEVLVVRDDEDDRYNAGIYRMMEKGPRKTGIGIGPNQDLYSILKRHEERNEPLEFAAYIGHHPTAVMGSQIGISSVDEYEAISSVYGETLELVPCETNDLLVPAQAELVLEGRILPNVREKEAPFGEYTYLLGEERNSPVTEINAITHRKNPIYYNVHSPYVDHLNHGDLPRNASAFERIKEVLPQVQEVNLPAETSHFLAIVQVKNEYEGIGMNAAMSAASVGRVKYVIVVDEEQDPYNLYDVLWAVAMKVNPDRDINMVSNSYIEALDPLGTDGRGWPHLGGGASTRVLIDATKPRDVDYPPTCEPPREVWSNIDPGEYFQDPS